MFLRILTYSVSTLLAGFLALVYLSSSATCPVDEDLAGDKDPDELPDFEFSLMESQETISNENLEGYTMIYFWSTSCGICIAEMPALHETYASLEDENFEILAISVSESVEKFKKFREEEYPMPWKHVFLGNNREEARETFMNFGVRGTPQKILVSPEGEILTRITGASGEELVGEIQSYIESG